MQAAITRMLVVDISLGNTTNGNTAAAQRHHLGPAFAGSFSRGPVAGDCRYQLAPRGHDDVRHRWRIHQVDVLGNRVSDAAATVELVHFVWSSRPVARRRNRDGMAGKPS